MGRFSSVSLPIAYFDNDFKAADSSDDIDVKAEIERDNEDVDEVVGGAPALLLVALLYRGRES